MECDEVFVCGGKHATSQTNNLSPVSPYLVSFLFIYGHLCSIIILFLNI